jgi:hypothetical protein
MARIGNPLHYNIERTRSAPINIIRVFDSAHDDGGVFAERPTSPTAANGWTTMWSTAAAPNAPARKAKPSRINKENEERVSVARRRLDFGVLETVAQ